MNSAEENPQKVGGRLPPISITFFRQKTGQTLFVVYFWSTFSSKIYSAKQYLKPSLIFFVQGVANFNKPVAPLAMLCSPSPIQPQATGPATSRWSDYSTTFNSLRPPESSILTPFMGSIHSQKLKLLLTSLISKFPLLSSMIDLNRAGWHRRHSFFTNSCNHNCSSVCRPSFHLPPFTLWSLLTIVLYWYLY